MRWLRFRNVVWRAGGLAAIPLLAVACQSQPELQPPPPGGGVACTMQFVYGISATVIDSATGANITPGSYMIVREGSYKDSVSAMGGFLSAAGERAGTYSVTIGRPGYSSFHRTGVIVTRDECHVHPVRIEARLKRAG